MSTHKCDVSTDKKRVTAAIVLHNCVVSTKVCCVAGNKRVTVAIALHKCVVLTQVCCVVLQAISV